MSEANWIPGIPTSCGWFMVKRPDGEKTVIRVVKYPHDKCFYYWSMEYSGRQPFESTMSGMMNLDEVYSHHCPLNFPEN